MLGSGFDNHPEIIVPMLLSDITYEQSKTIHPLPQLS